MKIIQAGYEIIRPDMSSDAGCAAIYRLIESAGRTCYKTENSANVEGTERFIRTLIQKHHEAMLEHASITVKFTVDRAVANEIVRHRLCSFAQESTRYCNYGTKRFGSEITVIEPMYLDKSSAAYEMWMKSCIVAEDTYFKLLDFGCAPEEARAVLPLSTKTEIVVTANIREWRHILSLRAAGTTGRPHPQMVEVMRPLLDELKAYLPALFGDIGGDDT